MVEIELKQIKKNYGIKNVLDGLNLKIKTGEKVAIIGQNGSGKSTILKIIAKQERVDTGTINIRNGAKIGILNQIYENEKQNICVKDFLYKSFDEILKIQKKLNELENQMSAEIDRVKLEKLINEYGRIQDNFILAGGYDINEKFNKICSKFYIDEIMLKQNYNYLSGGEKTKVNLAKLLLTEPDILLLDEPTNHLDIHSLEFLEELILNYKGAVIIVSHDRYFLDKVINKTILIENGKEKVYYGNYSYFIEEDEKRTLAQFEIYKNQQKQIKQMKDAIAQLRKFGELAGNEMFFKRAKSIEKRLEKMNIEESVKKNQKPFNLTFNIENRTGNDVITIEKLTKKYEKKILFENANLNIYYGEKIALTGENGAGKSTLLKIILKQDSNFQGKLKISEKSQIGYIPQNIMFEEKSKTVLEYFLEKTNLLETEARSKLAQFGFRNENVFKKIEKLSGGEKVRLILLELMQKEYNFLILDEPTNHIDIDTREILEEALKKYKGTILFVSHDRFFINTIANRIVNIENYKMKSYYGNYNDYMRTINKNEK